MVGGRHSSGSAEEKQTLEPGRSCWLCVVPAGIAWVRHKRSCSTRADIWAEKLGPGACRTESS